jgi:hypothetical protein
VFEKWPALMTEVSVDWEDMGAMVSQAPMSLPPIFKRDCKIIYGIFNGENALSDKEVVISFKVSLFTFKLKIHIENRIISELKEKIL